MGVLAGAETALALSRLIFDGTLDRHPGLKLLAAHGGGFLPAYIGRSDHAWEHRPDARGLPAGDRGAIVSGNAAGLLGHNDPRRTPPSEAGAHGRTE